MISVLFGSVWLLFTVLSIVLYRLGGSDWFNTKVRDIGAPITMFLAFSPWLHPNWLLILALMATHFAACTPGYGGEDEPVQDQSHLYRWFGRYTFIAVGALFGAASFPMIFVGVSWKLIIMRMYVVGALVYLLHEGRFWLYNNLFREWFEDVAEMEEMLRWLIVIVTFWLLLI